MSGQRAASFSSCCSESGSRKSAPESIRICSLRGSADRSRPSGRPTLPSVAFPSFSDESPDDNHHLGERHPEVHHSPHTLRAPKELLVGVVPRARPLHHPPPRGPERRRLALPRDLPPQAQVPKPLAGGTRVVAAVEVRS